MNKKLNFSLIKPIKNLLLTGLVLVAATLGMRGQDIPDTYVLNVMDFSELQVVDNLNVIYRCNPDSAGMAVFNSPKPIASAFVFSNRKNRLKIEQNLDLDLKGETLPTVTVYSSFLQFAENCGDSTLTVISPPSTSKFKARIIGNGNLIVTGIHATQAEGRLDTGKGTLVMSGLAKEVKLNNIGTGTIDAEGLSAETGTVTIIGTGPVRCDVSQKLTVRGTGTGKVYLLGDPTVKKMTLGKIQIIKL